MVNVLLFEAWSIANIAGAINIAVSGLGTDETALAKALALIPDRNTLVEINKLMSASDQFVYKTVGDAIAGELGSFDSAISKQIQAHFAKIGATDLISATKLPTPQVDPLISSIVSRVKQHEGVKPKVYKDSRGIPTVGVGFNLTRDDSISKLKAVGANPVKIKAGQAQLSNAQIDTLLLQDLMAARENAQAVVTSFNQLPAQVQGVLIEMTFNLGRSGLREFKNFLSHINNKRFDKAADEMLKSDWAKQVGTRAQTLAGIIKKSRQS